MPSPSFFPIPLSPRHPLVQLATRVDSRSTSPLACASDAEAKRSYRHFDQCPRSNVFPHDDDNDSCDGFYSARSCVSAVSYGRHSREASPDPAQTSSAPDGIVCPRRSVVPVMAAGLRERNASASPPPLIPESMVPAHDTVNSFLVRIMTSEGRDTTYPCLSPCRPLASLRQTVDPALAVWPILSWLSGREETARAAVEKAEAQCRDSITCHARLFAVVGGAAASSDRQMHRALCSPARAHHEADETIPFVDATCSTERQWRRSRPGADNSLLSSSLSSSLSPCQRTSSSPLGMTPLVVLPATTSRTDHCCGNMASPSSHEILMGSSPSSCVARGDVDLACFFDDPLLARLHTQAAPPPAVSYS